MTVARTHPIIALLVVGLFLYWVVQDPIGAAGMIHVVFDATMGLLELLADRFVEFLNALM